MKRIALLTVVLGCAATGATAQAGVSSKKTGEDPKEVSAYWTAERMKNAIPRDRVRGGQPKKEAAKPGTGSTTSWSTVKVDWSWATADPALRAHGKVFFSDGAYNYVCSGTAVNTTTGNPVVWTAGHCVNEGPGAFYSKFLFVPAYNSNGTEPYGRWAGPDLFTTSQWQSAGDFGHDLGAARVVPATSGALLPARRTLNFTPDTRTGGVNPIDSYGYPAEGKFTGQSMYLCESYVSRLDTSTNPPTYGIPCGMNGGSSGGGWVDEDSGEVVSVNSYGYSSLKNTMFGPQQGDVARALLETAD